MNENAPELITINNDDYHAEFVGRTVDNKQFFLTIPFIPESSNEEGREFVALYLFSSDGKLLEAKIDDLGTREEMDDEYRETLFQNRIEELGEVSYEPIIIAPFRVEKFNTEFGLIAHEPEEEDEDWWATFEPGNVMAFYPPWDSGDYDT
jgi:hypothetical protein